jgi:hypothetical protein
MPILGEQQMGPTTMRQEEEILMSFRRRNREMEREPKSKGRKE